MISGTQSKRVLFRALGPSLAASVTGAISDPKIRIVNSAGQIVASNDDWATDPAVAGTGLAPTNPLDAALVVTLPPGGFTAIVDGYNGATGVALVEAYELP